MITSNEMNRILRYLTRTGLPLDLQVEVRDHMVEQIETLMEEEKIDFEDAFSNVLKNWEKDLKPTFSLFELRMIPALQKKVTNEFALAVSKKTLFVFIPILIVFISLVGNKNLFFYFSFSVQLFLVCIYIFHLIRYYSIFRKVSSIAANGTSYLQRVLKIINWLILPVSLLRLLRYNGGSEKFYDAFSDVVHFDFSTNSVYKVFIRLFIIFWGIAGIFYFLEFKKVVHFLQRKINYKI